MPDCDEGFGRHPDNDKRLELKQHYEEKQRYAQPSRYYGDGGTIHGTNHLDVETDRKGNVVAVWFRCQMLPFKQTVEDSERVKEMRSVRGLPKITGVEVLDPVHT